MRSRESSLSKSSSSVPNKSHSVNVKQPGSDQETVESLQGKIARHNDNVARVSLGIIFYNKGDHDLEAFNLFQYASEANNIKAKLHLANMYHEARVPGKLYELERRQEIYRLYMQAAALGSPEAHYHLGVMYLEGKIIDGGNEADQREIAVDFLRKAAPCVTDAVFRLACLYEEDITKFNSNADSDESKKNYHEVERLLNYAVQLNHAGAMNFLAEMCRKGQLNDCIDDPQLEAHTLYKHSAILSGLQPLTHFNDLEVEIRSRANSAPPGSTLWKEVIEKTTPRTTPKSTPRTNEHGEYSLNLT